MKDIPNSSPENSTTKTKGNIPKNTYINFTFIILYVNPLNIFKSIWPDSILAASLNPKEIFLAKYEINSINTNRNINPNGQPDGTNNEKKVNLFLVNPNIVAPITIVKLREKVIIKWEVVAKL